jgi:hypothetical protein
VNGEFMLGLRRDVREAAGVEIGDTVPVEVSLDTAPREVDLTEPLASALAGDPLAAKAFAAMSFTHRKEYARWVAARPHPGRARRPAARAGLTSPW